MEEQRKPLFVRLPAPTAKKLDHVAVELGMSKQDLVADLVEQRLPFPGGGTRRVIVETADDTLSVGRAEFFPTEAPEVLTLDEAAELLRIDPDQLAQLADSGEVPGRKLGEDWRFTRASLLNWLGNNYEED
jgi:excisionase family DNA binding protein